MTSPTEHGQAARAPLADILTHLVALNHERTAEEKRGLIRWLRPDYQSPGAGALADGGKVKFGGHGSSVVTGGNDGNS